MHHYASGIWREIQEEYEKVFLNFKKLGNHNSSFTKAAIVVYKREKLAQEEDEKSNEYSVSVDSFDLNGFLLFHQPHLMTYLCLWLKN